MSFTTQHYTNLFNRLLEGELSPEEADYIIAWLGKEELDSTAKELIVTQLKQFVDPEKISSQVILTLEAKLPAIFSHSSENAVVPSSDGQSSSIEIASNDRMGDIHPVHRIHFLRTAWFRYAAAILLLFGSVAYFWSTSKNPDQTVANGNKPLQADIEPGTNKAVLTLADGSTIVLDNATNGELAQQGNAAIVKLNKGEIAYNLKGVAEGEVMMNMMRTPRGGQYQLMLPDGTKVWLNAASSITFPTAFRGAERMVTITGEVYMEVAQNAKMPFKVMAGNTTIQVLGTSFNINAYVDEESQKTTLVSGSVRIVADNKQVVLKPGQQTIIVNQGSITVQTTDTEQDIAWKNGVFDFTNLDIRTALKQIARWYDIEIKYEGKTNNIVLSGKVGRNLNLSEMMQILEDQGIQYKKETDRKIIVFSK